jgi:hypothetical protein
MSRCNDAALKEYNIVNSANKQGFGTMGYAYSTDASFKFARSLEP